VELAIFRISQEALMNTAKHAETKKVKITLGLDAGTVRFTVVDNGKGFIPPSMSHPQESGWGMTIMRERAELVGGKFSFDSHPGQGTAITVEIPMEGSR
jgi:signal transduction histidine kinase